MGRGDLAQLTQADPFANHFKGSSLAGFLVFDFAQLEGFGGLEQAAFDQILQIRR